MNSKYARGRQTIGLALLISILVLTITPASTVSAEAKESTALLAVFGKVSPANGIDNQPVTVTLKWTAAPANPYGYGKYYKYCYYTSGGTCSFDGGLYTTQHTISGLTKGTTYYWQILVVYCKDSGCVQKERHEADDGQVWSFRTGGVQPPGSFAKLSPTNNTLNFTNRILSWSSSPGATSYQYCFSPILIDSNCTHLNGWRDVGNVTSVTIPNDAKLIWGNTYYWQARASNSGGATVADAGAWWTFTTANLVGKATLVSPAGAITEYTPTYRWNAMAGVTWYYLWINGPTGNVFRQWYESGAVCSGTTCAATPSITLGAGNHTWWVQTWNSTGYGPWSNSLTFSTPIPTPPAATTLVSPSGNIGTSYIPAFTWNKVTSATFYSLWISKVNADQTVTTVYTAGYPASGNPALVCGATTCTATPGIHLGGGTFRWWVQTANAVGYGPWSTSLDFSTTILSAATLVSPTGSITDTTPNYTWNRVTASTWYYLWVSKVNADGSLTPVYTEWHDASLVCGGATCSFSPAVTLSTGNYRWWIQTWNNGGYGPWSSATNFSLP